jgi:hypothetical protein
LTIFAAFLGHLCTFFFGQIYYQSNKGKKISNNRHPTHTKGIGIKIQLNIQLPKGMETIIEQLLLILENN